MLEGLRELKGTVSIARLAEMGIDTVLTNEGGKLAEGSVAMADRIRPSRIDGKPVLFVTMEKDAFYPVTL
ncbi:MAG: hypothetical protein JSV43_03515 [Methanobacteriota archaeon]|nr:MAG: hypothetical protein JSV43_03515 [Euryarchaeota archaeon]